MLKPPGPKNYGKEIDLEIPGAGGAQSFFSTVDGVGWAGLRLDFDLGGVEPANHRPNDAAGADFSGYVPGGQFLIPAERAYRDRTLISDILLPGRSRIRIT